MSKGILLVAHNNELIDYGRMALANALLIKHHLTVNNITLVTDLLTYNKMDNDFGKRLIKKCFEQIIIVKDEAETCKKRTFYDKHDFVNVTYKNMTKSKIYELSPYDETLHIDVDYMIQCNMLDMVWDSVYPLRINKTLRSMNNPVFLYKQNINELTIPTYWATVYYFRKSSFNDQLFALVDYIKENYEYYSNIYKYNHLLFRNDYAISIAIHILSGYTGHNFNVTTLPYPSLMFAWEKDEVLKYTKSKGFMFTKKHYQSIVPQYINRTDIHIMNKMSLNRVSERIVRLYGK